jgi:hypothetical protein
VEAERQKFEQVGVIKDGQVTEVGPDRAVGPVQKFEFGSPDDNITLVVGGGYMSAHNFDFLQRELGKDGTCDRFYFDKRVVVDIADPDSKISRIKRKLLFRNHFGYLCIPVGFPREEQSLKNLYGTAIAEYREYARIHPRPKSHSEMMLLGKDGSARRAMVTDTQIDVGGGVIGGAEQQAKEMQSAEKLTKKELRQVKLLAKMHRKLRKAAQNGTPFRNPFIAPGRRLYPIQYN